jgi:hypothetical protein
MYELTGQLQNSAFVKLVCESGYLNCSTVSEGSYGVGILKLRIAK